MDFFCVQRLALPPQLRPRHGVLSAEALAVASDARRAARLMLDQARAEADTIVAQAKARAADATRQEKQRVAREATQLLQGLEQAQDSLLDGVGSLALEWTQRLFERLLLELSPAERIGAALQRLRQEAPTRLVEAVLWVHPEDQPLIGACPWEVRTDARMERGACRLEASSGQWQASFTLAASALSDAMAGQAALFSPAADVGAPAASPSAGDES